MGGLFAALALLSVVLSRINLAISRSLHKNKRSALLHVFEHLQLELMLLGMLSLLLQVAQEGLLKICVKYASASGDDYCPAGEKSLWSATVLHQTHIFVFLLACTHCLLYTSPSPRDMRRSRMPSSA